MQMFPLRQTRFKKTLRNWVWMLVNHTAAICLIVIVRLTIATSTIIHFPQFCFLPSQTVPGLSPPLIHQMIAITTKRFLFSVLFEGFLRMHATQITYITAWKCNLLSAFGAHNGPIWHESTTTVSGRDGWWAGHHWWLLINDARDACCPCSCHTQPNWVYA